MFIDVKKVRLNGRVPDDEFACVKHPDGKMRLKRWLCGARPAAQASKMLSIGFARGSNSAVFRRQSIGRGRVVHGDAFRFLCCGAHAGELGDKMCQWYDLKVRAVVGDDDGDDEEVTFLNMTSKHTSDGLQILSEPETRSRNWS